MDDETAKKVWEEAKERLSKELRQDVYGRWIAPLGSPKEHDGKLTFGVANDFYVDWLEEHYSPKIVDALKSKGFDGEIEFMVDTSLKPIQPTGEQKKPTPMENPSPKESARGLNPRYTLDTLVVGNSNRVAAAVAQDIVTSRESSGSYFYGPVGIGKTRLLQSIVDGLVSTAKVNPRTVHYTSAEGFANEYIEALKSGRLSEFRRKSRGKVLALDEIDWFERTEKLQAEVKSSLDEVISSGGKVILTGQKKVGDLKLFPDLLSRLSEFTQVKMSPPSPEERERIARSYLEVERGIKDYNPEHIRFIAQMSTDARGMLGAIKTYMLLTTGSFNEIRSIQDIEAKLGDCLRKGNSPGYERILDVVGNYRKVHTNKIIGKGRGKQEVSRARAEAMYLARECTGQSFTMIGAAFGKNHTTVMAAYDKVQAQIKMDFAYEQEMAEMRKRVNEN